MPPRTHEVYVQQIINYSLKLLKHPHLSFHPMRRTKAVKKNSSYIEGHTSLSTGKIIIDIYTARLRKPKKISAILAVLAHEVAHHQKPPYLQRYQGRIITRAHYPQFYKQVAKNIKKFKKDTVLQQFY